jgi:hypothetical protein
MYAFVLIELEKAKGKWAAVASATGMSKRTIEKIARQEIADPGVSHIEKLASHFGFFPRQSGKRRAALNA